MKNQDQDFKLKIDSECFGTAFSESAPECKYCDARSLCEEILRVDAVKPKKAPH